MFSFLRNVAANSAASPDANIIAMGGVIISMAKTTLMGTSFDLNVQGTDKKVHVNTPGKFSVLNH